MKDLVMSLIRTWAAMLAGAAVAWAVRQGLLTDSSVAQPLTEVLTVAFGAVYYLVVRLLERINPKAGWLLGVPHPPVYPTANPPAKV